MDKMKNKVLCIPSEKLFVKGKWSGLNTKDIEIYKKLLNENSQFKIRGKLENDENFKQIIPQIILNFNNKYFLHQENSTNEVRLRKLSPIFLGGHVEKFDKGNSSWDFIETAAMRELEEEVKIKSKILDRKFRGLMYIEDENPVNQYHLGIIYEYFLDGDKVKSQEEGMIDKGFVDKKYLLDHKKELTYWSQVYLDFLK